MAVGHREFILVFGAIAASANGCVSTFSGCEASRTCASPEGGTSASGGEPGGSATEPESPGAGTRSKGSTGPTAGEGGFEAGAGGSQIGASDGGQAGGGAAASEGGAPSDDSLGGGAGAPEPVLATVRVVDDDNHNAIEGATVFASDANGELLAIARTTKDGTAHLEVPTGGSVTAALTASYARDDGTHTFSTLCTASQVESGATVTLPVYVPTDFTSPEPMHLAITLQTGWTGSNNYWDNFALCGGFYNGDVASTQLWEDDSVVPCFHATTFDIWALIRNGDGGLVAFGSDLGLPFVPGGTAERTLTVNNTNIFTARLNVTGIPPGSEWLDFRIRASTRDRAGSLLQLDTPAVRLPSVDETLEVDYPAAGFTEYQAAASITVQSDPSQYIGLARTGAGVSRERDWSADRLARFKASPITEHSADGSLGVSWKLVDSGELGDAILVRVDWAGASWSAYVPAKRSGTVTFPELPDSLSYLRPSPQEELTPYALHEDVSETATYADFLARANQLEALNIEYANTK